MRRLIHRLYRLYYRGGPSAVFTGALRFLRYRYPASQVSLRSKFNKVKYSAYSDPLAVIQISPADVNTWTDRFGTYHHIGAIRGGDWDLKAKSFETHPKYKAVKRRFVDGVSWKETGVFDYMRSRIESEGCLDGCRTPSDIGDRYSDIDVLYERIKHDGYRSHREVSSESDFEAIADEVIVNIGRDGQLVFNGTGWHRLSIAKILDIDKIPAIVGVRHKLWQTLRERLNNTNTQNVEPTLCTHPDLQHIFES
ncbi:ParB-like nuclease domain containing protein [Natrarchaeobaculum sulfurireducens]|uniref:ParB-like nuclease domain containing protein n=1 Tax=Natrarchaeobaculum sulfurireducens TaxID=2044521 RepID=A0A346PCE6_9EURY|nr:ParB-like nuclease domain containing protein [Natrarchaeobaculum sulfurireducens]